MYYIQLESGLVVKGDPRLLWTDNEGTLYHGLARVYSVTRIR